MKFLLAFAAGLFWILWCAECVRCDRAKAKAERLRIAVAAERQRADELEALYRRHLCASGYVDDATIVDLLPENDEAAGTFSTFSRTVMTKWGLES